MKVLVTQLCLTLCNPVDCSLLVSSVHGILQARILEWFSLPSPENLPDPGIEPRFPTLQAESLLSEPLGHIHLWVSLLWPSCFILSRPMSNCPLLFPGSIVDTFQPWREVIFYCHISIPFHSVHGVLSARILEWVVIPSSSEPHFARTLYHDQSILHCPAWYSS